MKTVFGYDEADQLESEVCTDDALSTIYSRSYVYDYNGNRTSVIKNGSEQTTYVYDWQDRLTSAERRTYPGLVLLDTKTYIYDNNGACTEVKLNGNTTATLAYDYENRVTSLAQTGVTTNTFGYNGQNLRVTKTDSSGTFNYVTDGTSPASAVLKDGAALYNPGISERRSTTSKYYHTDGIGSTRGITDSSQNTTDTALYEAFGGVVSRTGTTPTPFLFAGELQYQTDGDSSLQLLGHRYYDPSTGHFLSKDPAQSGSNWYAYCRNNPVKQADPSGLVTLDTALDVIGTLADIWDFAQNPGWGTGATLGGGIIAIFLPGGVSPSTAKRGKGLLEGIGNWLGDIAHKIGKWFDRPPDLPVRATVPELLFPEKVPGLMDDMRKGDFLYERPEAIISGNKYNGIHYIEEGHHRTEAAVEILIQDGNREPLDNLLDNGIWTIVDEPPRRSYPFPLR